ncbi:DUF2442 domain-containing protein [Porticoccus sp. W117]|uniref:DUF2442 domain-containing protein n=1 Tax=Porticoccus sp. W117 TaxID=3054777 RepID=UPI00259418A9|nr:DUF2442 domain-containing protein [Porticoccus sp. W117]MDM3870522.1 DUF2442 domain-containing protein [Porticoccus sp. W117]
MLHIKSARYVSDYILWVAFDDGTDGKIDIKNELKGPVFEPLKDVAIFSKVAVDPELETVVWPNGADFAPEFLKELYQKQNQQVA